MSVRVRAAVVMMLVLSGPRVAVVWGQELGGAGRAGDGHRPVRWCDAGRRREDQQPGERLDAHGMTDFPESGRAVPGTGTDAAFGRICFLLPNSMYGAWTTKVTRIMP